MKCQGLFLEKNMKTISKCLQWNLCKRATFETDFKIVIDVEKVLVL